MPAAFAKPANARLFALASLAAMTGAQATAISWSSMLPRLPEADEEIVITRTEQGRRASLRRRGGAESAVLPLPISAPLLHDARAAAFGVEERCQMTRNGDAIAIDCKAGSRVAGIVATFGDQHLPRGARLQMALGSNGSTGFSAAVAPLGEDAANTRPVTGKRTALPMDAVPASRPVQFVVVAPSEGGRLVLSDLWLEPIVAGVWAAGAAAWAWEPQAWRFRGDELIASARARDLERLFISLTIAQGRVRDARKLQGFVAAAHDAGIAIEAVEGDPEMVGEGLAPALLRARAIAAYQAASPPAARLDGLQYDVEPYILPGWRDRDDSYRRWGDAILALSEAAGMKVNLVAPFWLANSERGRLMLDRAAPAVRMVTAMAYRTEAQALQCVAEPLLAWGAAHDKPVRLALEAGPLLEEEETHFIRADEGTLALQHGQHPRLNLLDRPGKASNASMWRAAGTSNIRAADLSFLGDETQMRRTADNLAPMFSAWPSFAGFAFHGYRWPQ